MNKTEFLFAVFIGMCIGFFLGYMYVWIFEVDIYMLVPKTEELTSNICQNIFKSKMLKFLL